MNARNLRHSKVYLCGQVENDLANASSWRKELTQDLVKIEPDLIVWDPLIKPEWMSPDSRDDKIAFNKEAMFRLAPTPENLLLGRRGWEAADEIRQVCQKLTASADFIIARITKTFTWGSIDELEIAARQDKPIFFWLPDGPVSTYGLPGCVPVFDLIDEYIFYNKEDILAAIQKINNGTSMLVEKDPYTWTYLTYINSANYEEK
jgi:hypothetical protein